MSKEHYRKKNKGPVSEELFLDSWSGLQEYLDKAPDRIKRIECPERDVKRLEGLLSARRGEFQVIPTDQPLRVYVKESFKDESSLELLEFSEKEVVIALDHITDTRNLGAIIRSAAFFGVQTIVVPNKRQAPIAQGTLATCQGALTYSSAYSVVNLVRALKKMKDKGFWIIGADMGGEPLERYSSKFDKVVLVMGSEEKGISRLVREACDIIVSIPGRPNSVESLNVSVASGILVQEFTKPILTV